jgi:hypothetical protein
MLLLVRKTYVVDTAGLVLSTDGSAAIENGVMC